MICTNTKPCPLPNTCSSSPWISPKKHHKRAHRMGSLMSLNKKISKEEMEMALTKAKEIVSSHPAVVFRSHPSLFFTDFPLLFSFKFRFTVPPLSVLHSFLIVYSEFKIVFFLVICCCRSFKFNQN